MEGWRNTSYGKEKVLTKNGGRVRWTIKINCFHRWCVIGIDEGQLNADYSFWDSKKSTHYAWSADSGEITGTQPVQRSEEDNDVEHEGDVTWNLTQFSSWKSFSDTCADGDIFHMELDLDHNTLSFAIHDEEMKVAFTNIKRTEIGYSLAVYLYDVGDSVSILSMEHIAG